MTTHHAIAWIDGAEAHVLMFDRMACDPSRA